MKPIINNIEKQEAADKQGCICWSITYADNDTGEVNKLHFDIPVVVGEKENVTLLKKLLEYYIISDNKKSDYSKVIKLLKIVGKFTDTAKISDLEEVIAEMK